MLRAVIIEDEDRGRIVLENLLETYCPKITNVGTAGSLRSGINVIRQEEPDLMFLDVQLTDGTGFDILDKIKLKNCAVIFTTAFDQYALKAFKFSAIDYLLKPIDIDDLTSAVAKVEDAGKDSQYHYKVENLLSNLKRSPDEPPVLLVSTMEAVEFIRIKDIVRCEAQGAYCTLHLMDQKSILVSKVIKEFDFLLKEYGFYRVHQSHLINMREIRKFIKSESSLLMRDGTHIQLARSRKDGFFEELHNIQA
jgi:two-component system LytT family response regulator